MSGYTTDELGLHYVRVSHSSLPVRRVYPSHCCPLCGEPVGWLGNLFAFVFGVGFHGCNNTNVMHPQEYWNKREELRRTRASVSPARVGVDGK